MSKQLCCCGMTDEPNHIQRCFVRGMDFGLNEHCDYPEPWCKDCPAEALYISPDTAVRLSTARRAVEEEPPHEHRPPEPPGHED